MSYTTNIHNMNKLSDSQFESIIRKCYREGGVSGLPSNWTEDMFVEYMMANTGRIPPNGWTAERMRAVGCNEGSIEAYLNALNNVTPFAKRMSRFRQRAGPIALAIADEDEEETFSRKGFTQIDRALKNLSSW